MLSTNPPCACFAAGRIVSCFGAGGGGVVAACAGAVGGAVGAGAFAGAGAFTGGAATAVPSSRMTNAIASARMEANRRATRNVRFEVRDCAGIGDREAFDLVTAFDVLRDQSCPDAILRGAHHALRADGAFLMQDIRCSSHLKNNLEHPLAPLLYTISCMHCMSVSLASGGMGLGAAWGKQKALEMLRDAGFRVVPNCIVRHSAYIAPGVVLMPSFVNLGAYVDSGTMVDTWATVGSCAQIGKNVHLSGGVGIGGVLEPLQAGPTIIEDDCFIGARSEVVEGVIVEAGSVISMGVYIGQSTRIYNRETGEISYGRIPAGSVVVSGNLPSKDGKYSLYCAVIVKQVDAKTRSKVGINELLRSI